MIPAAALDPARSSARSSLWEGLDQLIDRTSDERLRAHQLEAPAALRRRALGLPVPEDFIDRERIAAATLLLTPALLAHLRATLDGPIVVYKGPEVAASYPDPVMRPYGDLDLLVADAPAVQKRLLSAGFRAIGAPERYEGIHHLRPVILDELPLRIEVHSHPKWPEAMSPPAFAELLETAVPSATGVPGVLAVEPGRHAVLVAAHAWAHNPLRRLRDLLDAAAVADDLPAGDVLERAREWRLERLWRTVASASDAVFRNPTRRLPLSLRTWGRHLPQATERTVFESHLQRLLSDCWLLPPRQAGAVMWRRIRDELSPAQGEEWREKLERSGRAVRNAKRPRIEHDRILGPKAQRRRRR
jgi:hypothetical protein